MNKEEFANLYAELNKELDTFNAEFFFSDDGEEGIGDPYTLNDFIYYLAHDNHVFQNEIQPYRDRVFK